MQSMVNQVLDDLNIANEDFIGVFLYGSQNYQLDYEGSDTDAILLVREANRAKQKIELSTGIIKVYTLKYFLYRLKQGDLECYEILYTKHRIINQMYTNYFIAFVEEFSSCMSYERIKNSLCKKLDEHLCNVLWMLQNKEKARYNKKRLYWAIRVCNQLERINQGEDFETSLIYRPLLGHDLMKIKTVVNYLSLKDFNEIYRYLVQFLRSMPKYSTEVSNKEEKCISALYYKIIIKYKIQKGDKLS